MRPLPAPRRRAQVSAKRDRQVTIGMQDSDGERASVADSPIAWSRPTGVVIFLGLVLRGRHRCTDAAPRSGAEALRRGRNGPRGAAKEGFNAHEGDCVK